VRAVQILAMRYPNRVTRLSESLQGEITRDDSGRLAGTANVTWELRSASVMCSYSHAITLGQAQLSGDVSNTEPVFMAEIDGAEYERRGQAACTASAIEAGNSLGDQLEPRAASRLLDSRTI